MHFSYSFLEKDNELRRNGEGTGAIFGVRLYLIAFEAPVFHYFARDIIWCHAIVRSARIG